jgi:hypothetical protein
MLLILPMVLVSAVVTTILKIIPAKTPMTRVISHANFQMPSQIVNLPRAGMISVQISLVFPQVYAQQARTVLLFVLHPDEKTCR